MHPGHRAHHGLPRPVLHAMRLPLQDWPLACAEDFTMTRPLLLSALILALAGPALADPCEAKVTGYKAGQMITGMVRYVGDGDGLCVGQSRDPNTWVEVRLADFMAPELNDPGGRAAKATLTRLAAGREAVCTVRRGRNGRTYSYDRVIASCTIKGRSLADLLRAAGVKEGGR